MKKTLIIVLSLAFFGVARAEYIKFGETPSIELFYENKEIRTNKNFRAFVVLVNRKKPGEENGQQVWSALETWGLDCETGKIGFFNSIKYSSAFAKGSIVQNDDYSNTPDADPKNWHHNSNAAKLVRALCP